MQDVRLPDFIILGAAKCGTTSLWSYLRKHPQVWFPEDKEPNYFALAGKPLPDRGPVPPEVMRPLIHGRSLTRFEDYVGLFVSAPENSKIGEASVRYLYYEGTAKRIRETLPDVRMVVVLRHPVSRMYSHYCMNVQYQLEPLSFRDALDAEPERIAAGWDWDWHYAAVSRYAEQLEAYFAVFPREQIHVVLFDELKRDPLATYHAVCQHIGVSADHVPDFRKRMKVTYTPRSLWFDRVLHWPNPTREKLLHMLPKKVRHGVRTVLRRLNSGPVPKLDPAIRRELCLSWVDEIGRLETLLGRSTGWLDKASAPLPAAASK